MSIATRAKFKSFRMATRAKIKSFRNRFDRRSLGGVLLAGVICLAMVAVVWFVARDAPSSTTGLTDRLRISDVDANQGCENFGRYWTDTSGANIDEQALERFSNCVRLDDGSVIASASMYGAVPIDESALTDDQRNQLEQTRIAIADQVDTLEATLPGSIQNAFNQLHTDGNNAVVGHFSEGKTWGPYRTRYARIVNAFMLDSDNAELSSFIGWIMARKIDGYADFRRECLANPNVAMLSAACRGVEDNLSIRYAPLPWELRDPDLLDTWFSETYVQPTHTSEG